jgi:hypothetical protein
MVRPARSTGRPRRSTRVPDSSRSRGVGRWWPFRAQLPVRTVVAPGGAFSAQTPPARPFSQPATHHDTLCPAASGRAELVLGVQPALFVGGGGCGSFGFEPAAGRSVVARWAARRSVRSPRSCCLLKYASAR